MNGPNSVDKARMVLRLAGSSILLALVSLAAISCGGGGGGGGGGGTNTVVRFAVNWGERSRALEGPGSAQSLTLRIAGAGVPSGDFLYTGNRDSNPAAHTQNFVTTGQAVAGSHLVTATFYAEPGAAGSVVGTASATMTVLADGNLSGSISTSGTIASVVVPTGQTVQVGELKQLAFTAKNASGGTVAVAPGAAVWAVATGPDKVEFVQTPPTDRGKARGLAEGTPTITASVDGHVSPAVALTVTAAPPITVSVSPSTATLGIFATQQFTATVTGTANTAVTWSVVEGPAGGSVSGTGLYTAPSLGGSFTVKAASVADPTKFGTAAVTVTDGGIPGNKIFYSVSSIDATEYRQINPDGTGDALVANYSANFDTISPNPAVPGYVFSHTTDPLDPNAVWRLYKNTSIQLSGATQLSPTGFVYFGTTRFTPNGSRIVFTGSVADGEFGVYVINADGSGQTRLDDGEEADVSPDGTKIVYTKLDPVSGYGEIWTMGIDGSAKTRLTNNSVEDWFPKWSRDGTRIVFSSDRSDAQFDIYTMSSVGTGVVRVTNSLDGDEFGSSMNPTGTQIACVSLGLDVNDTGLYRVDSNGANRTSLRLVPNINQDAFWSPGSSSRPGAGANFWPGGKNHRYRRR